MAYAKQLAHLSFHLDKSAARASKRNFYNTSFAAKSNFTSMNDLVIISFKRRSQWNQSTKHVE